MVSPFEQKLFEKLALVEDPEARALIRVDLAVYWARVGDEAAAERERQDLRREFGDARSPRVSIGIMILEALQAYYSRLDPGARDRLMRASLLSKSFKDAGLIAQTSSWLAHIELNGARFDLMVKELKVAVEAAAKLDGSSDFTRCRIALTLGDANLIVGRLTASQAWYDVARREANEVGDHAAVGAMTYNRAALRVARARFEDVAKIESGIDRSLLRLDVESAVNYQSAARLRSLEHLLSTAKASLLIYQGRYADAIPIIEPLLASPEVAQKSAQRFLLEADLALALVETGRLEAARQGIASLAESINDGTSIPSDDFALIASSVSKALSCLNQDDEAGSWRTSVLRAVDEHNAVCAGLADQLLQFSPPSAV